jgi:hypothetical protein
VIGYLPEELVATIKPGLIKLGEEAVSPTIKDWGSNAEKQQPYVKTHDVWGARYDFDRLVTSEGWRELGKWGARHGYEHQSRHQRVF